MKIGFNYRDVMFRRVILILVDQYKLENSSETDLKILIIKAIFKQNGQTLAVFSFSDVRIYCFFLYYRIKE